MPKSRIYWSSNKLMMSTIFICYTLLFVLSVAEHQIPDENRLEEYYCQPDLKISDNLKKSLFVRLRGTVPNDIDVSMDQFYEKAISRFVENLPHVKFVSISGQVEYSADDSTDSVELKQELETIKQWMHIISEQFHKHSIKIMEFELFASFGFDDNTPLRQLMNETFGGNHVDMEFCSISFTCDIKVPLDYGSGEFLLSAELSDHLSKRITGRRSQQHISCEKYNQEDIAAIHQLQSYELADSVDLSAYQSKSTFYLDLPVIRNAHHIHQLYKETIRNFKHKLPNVKNVKIRAQSYFLPKNATSEPELKTELRYLKRWAQIVVKAFQEADIHVNSFDLIATLGFDHNIHLIDVFNDAFEDNEASIEGYLSRNLYNAIIPLEDTNVKLQSELLLNGGLMSSNSASKRRLNATNFFTLRKLLQSSD